MIFSKTFSAYALSAGESLPFLTWHKSLPESPLGTFATFSLIDLPYASGALNVSYYFSFFPSNPRTIASCVFFSLIHFPSPSLILLSPTQTSDPRWDMLFPGSLSKLLCLLQISSLLRCSDPSSWQLQFYLAVSCGIHTQSRAWIWNRYVSETDFTNLWTLLPSKKAFRFHKLQNCFICTIG